MSKLARIGDLMAPPIVGQFYLVPTVHGRWYGKVRNWTVMGELHQDVKFFAFDKWHYHLDRRFLLSDLHAYAMRAPLHSQPKCDLGPIVWRRRKCLSSGQEWSYGREMVCRKMQKAMAGVACKSDGRGLICPHRNYSLAQVIPDERGFLTCPLHGLRIDAANGRVATDA